MCVRMCVHVCVRMHVCMHSVYGNITHLVGGHELGLGRHGLQHPLDVLREGRPRRRRRDIRNIRNVPATTFSHREVRGAPVGNFFVLGLSVTLGPFFGRGRCQFVRH